LGGEARWLDEPLGQNIGGLEPLGPHEVGAYGYGPLITVGGGQEWSVPGGD